MRTPSSHLGAYLIGKWRVLLALLLVPLLLAGIGIAWLCYTASGLQFALLQLNRVPGIKVQVQGVTGQLAGPLHVQHLTLEQERVHLEIEQLEVDLTPAYLLSGLIEINKLQAERISATLKPSTRQSPDKPVHFLPAFLRISIDQLDIKQAQYVNTNGYQIVATPLQAAVDLSYSHLRLRKLNAITRDFDLRGEVALDSATVLNLTAEVDADYKLTNGPVLSGQINSAGAVTGKLRELKFDAELRQPHQALINGVLAFPDTGWSIRGNAKAEKVLLDVWWPQPTFSLANLMAQFKLSDAGMHYAGEVVIPEWSAAPLQFDADTHYRQRVFSIDRAALNMRSSGVRTLTRGSITLQTNAKPLLNMQSSWSYLQWPLNADKAQAWFTSTQGTLQLNGALPYQFEVSAHVAAPRWPDSPLQARGEIRSGAIQIASFTTQTLQGSATGSALVGLSGPRNWQFSLQARDINPAELLAEWPGRLNIQATAQGQGYTVASPFDLKLSGLSGTLRNQGISAKGRLQHQGDNWLADALTAQWGRTQLTAQGNVSLPSPSGRAAPRKLATQTTKQNNLQWTLNVPMLKQLHPDAAGDLNMTGVFTGTVETPQFTVRAHSTRMSYGLWQADNFKLDTHIDVTDKTDSRLDLSSNRISNGAMTLEKLQLTGVGRATQHQLNLQTTPLHTLLPKGLQLNVQVAGGYADSQWRGTVDNFKVIDAQQATRLNLLTPTAVLLGKQHIQVQPLCVSLDAGKACVNADWLNAAAGAQWNAHASLQDLPLILANGAMADSAALHARANGQLDLSATPGMPWQGAGTLSLDEASIRYKNLGGREQVLPISYAQATLSADARAVQTKADLHISEQTVTSLNVTLDRTIGNGLSSWPLSGVLSLSSSDAQLIPVFVNEVDRAAGTLAAVLQLSGTASAPHVAGNVRLLQGELDFYQLNLALRALEFNGDIDTDRLRFTAQGNAGEGMLNASGDLNWRNAKLFGNLQLKGERLLVADLPEYRVLATPDLRFDINDRDIAVKGEVLIPEARLQPKEVVGAIRTSADARFKTDKVLEREENPWRIKSDVKISLGDSVNFDGLGLQGRLNGSLATQLSTGAVPTGSGELSVANGRYEAYAQKLDIKRGRLIYDNTPLDDPGLDIQAERMVNEITVGVYVRGVLRAPRLQFYSDPSMSQTQIVSYLLVGKPLDELQGQEATTVRSASNTLAVSGGGYIASQLGRRIGLEEVGVETDAKNQSALVLGKFLSPKLFISYGISLTEAINTIKLRYSLSDHWTLKTEAGEAKSADIEYKIER